MKAAQRKRERRHMVRVTMSRPLPCRSTRRVRLEVARDQRSWGIRGHGGAEVTVDQRSRGNRGRVRSKHVGSRVVAQVESCKIRGFERSEVTSGAEAVLAPEPKGRRRSDGGGGEWRRKERQRDGRKGTAVEEESDGSQV